MTARLVPEHHLMNATSLNTASQNLPNVAGPAAGGVLIGLVGVSAAYFVTTGAYAVAFLLLSLGVASTLGRIERVEKASLTADLREAWVALAAPLANLAVAGGLYLFAGARATRTRSMPGG